MKITLNWIYTVVIISLLTGCASQGTPENFDYGSVTDNIYTNDFFKCTINLPEDWVVQSREQTEQLTEMGKEIATGGNEELETIVKASEINSASLLTVFQYEIGSPVEYNPNIMIIAENVSHAPGIKKGSDYLFQSRNFLEKSNMQYDYLSEEFVNVMINGAEFYRMDAHINYMGLEIKQEYYSTIRDGFSFDMIVSYIT